RYGNPIGVAEPLRAKRRSPHTPRSRRRFPVTPRRPCASRDIARRARRDRSGSFSPPVRELSADTRWVTALLRHDQPIGTSRATDNRTSAEAAEKEPAGPWSTGGADGVAGITASLSRP